MATAVASRDHHHQHFTTFLPPVVSRPPPPPPPPPPRERNHNNDWLPRMCDGIICCCKETFRNNNKKNTSSHTSFIYILFNYFENEKKRQAGRSAPTLIAGRFILNDILFAYILGNISVRFRLARIAARINQQSSPIETLENIVKLEIIQELRHYLQRKIYHSVVVDSLL